jgi:NADH:ubiquinone oxidoreductase subunit 6 (subunit J)
MGVMKPGRIVIYGAIGFLWCMAVFGLGVFISKGTTGENYGKLVGTLVSLVAFVPPVLIFMRWYRATEGNSVTNRPPPADPKRASSGGDTP